MNDKYKQDAKSSGGYGEEIYRNKISYMIIKESTPGLRRRLPIADHVFGDGGFGHTDAEHLQFTMYSRSTPANVAPRHGPNQFANIGIDSWSTTPTPAGFPGPVQPKSLSMPSDQSVWLEDCQCPKAIWPETIEPNPEYSLAGSKAVPSVIAVGHHCQLLTQGKDLQMERGSAPQEIDQGGEQRN